jgi:hypothetical protein
LRTPRLSPTEKEFARQVTDLARILGWTHYRTWISVRSPSGFPDLILAKPGRPLVLAELKSERGRLSPAQRAWLELLRQVPGVEIHIWKPSDWESIVAVLSRDGPAVSVDGWGSPTAPRPGVC